MLSVRMEKDLWIGVLVGFRVGRERDEKTVGEAAVIEY
jgi:hypothetical protein